MQKMFLLFSVLVFSVTIFADISFFEENEDRYVVFGIGESQSIAKRNAEARAEKIAKQSGKKYEVVGESYSKFTGGYFWKCRLEVAFYKPLEVLAKKDKKYYIVGVGELREDAIQEAEDKIGSLSKKTGKIFEIIKEVIQEQADKNQWICYYVLEVYKDFAANSLEIEQQIQVPGLAETKEQALEAAQRKLKRVMSKIGKKLFVVKESFRKFSAAEAWLCVLVVSTSPNPQKEITGIGASIREAKHDAYTKLKKSNKKLEVIKTLIRKLANDQYLCTLVVKPK